MLLFSYQAPRIELEMGTVEGALNRLITLLCIYIYIVLYNVYMYNI